MLVKRRQRRAEVITVEELPGTAGVFGQNTVYRSENFNRPGGSVGEVPDRGSYDVKGTHTGSIALSPGTLVYPGLTLVFACAGLFVQPFGHRRKP